MSEKQFSLVRVFLKDLSFESPLETQAFTEASSPEISVDLNSEHKRLDPKHMQVSLCVTVTAKREDQVLFISEVDYAGIFMAEGFDEAELKHLLSVHCPTILFPYVRETLDSITVKGNFPALMLAPLNFDALFREAQAAEQTSTEEAMQTAH